MLPAWSIVFGIAFGAAVGSFLNVLIYRLPRNLSIVFPPSHCPACGHRLGVRDLIPLLSYLIQRGKCRYCGAPIPVRYFLVELWNAALWAWLWYEWLILGEAPGRFVLYAAASSVLIAIFFIDLEHYLIPDELNVALLAIGLLHGWLLQGVPTDWSWASLGVPSLRHAALGALAGAGLFSLIAILGRIGLRRDAMGHGDIKLARGMGALLLVPGVFVAVTLAVVLGAVVGGLWALARRRAAQESNGNEPPPEPEPEPLSNLVLACALYMLWVDALITLLPRRVQQQVYASMGQADEEEFVETPTTLPFGPFLALGTQLVLLFGEWFAGGVRAYLEWVGV